MWARALLLMMIGVSAGAQQTVFNVPSADILAPRAFYVESDSYARPWDSGAGRAAWTSLRGVAGLGRGIEAGLNLGAFDALHEGAPVADAAVKWAPAALTARESGIYLGGQAGVGVAGRTRGEGRGLAYGAMWTRKSAARVSAGPYFASRRVFNDRSRAGALATIDWKSPVKGLTLAADWFSGDGAYLTPGVIQSVGATTWYVGYGLANAGRRSDLLTVEIGLVFAGK